MKTTSFKIWTAFFFAFPLMTFGQISPLTLDGAPDSLIGLKSHASYFIDFEGNLGKPEILAIRKSGGFGDFEKMEWEENKFKRSRYVFWTAVHFENLTGDSLRPLLFFPDNRRVRIYDITREPGNLIKKFGVDEYAGDFSNRLTENRFITSLSLAPGETKLLIKSIGAYSGKEALNFKLCDFEFFYGKFWGTLVFQYILGAGFCCILIFMGIFAAIQYFQTKNLSFLFYLFYVIFLLFYSMREFDNASIVLHTVPLLFRNYIFYTYTTLLYYLFYLYFIKYFLDTKTQLPSLDKFIIAASNFLLIYMVAAPVLQYYQINWEVFSYFKVVFFLGSIYIIVTLLRNQSPLTNYILFGSLCLVAGGIIAALINAEYNGSWTRGDHLAGALGVIAENIIFMAGLSYKSKLLTKEKEREIQELKQIEKERALRLRLSETKNYLLTNITHEFRTPLTLILGFAENLRQNIKNESRNKLDLIRKNGLELLDLVNQMLDLSMISDGMMSLNMIHGNIVFWIKNHMDSFFSHGKESGIKLAFESSEEVILMDFDPEKILRILNNLLANSLKFTPAGGEITVSTKKENKSFILEISDNGNGILPKDLPFVFDRFFRGIQPVEKTTSGTGLGLALVKELVNLMNGKITAESNPGVKTTFRVRLPVTNNAPLKENLSIGKQASFEFPDVGFENFNENDSAPLLLIIEDNPELIYYLKTCLAGFFRIITSENGKAGIKRAIEKIPDIIISDVMMPGTDGFEVCKVLKKDERTSHIPIILLTAKARQEEKIEGLTYGADAYLTKPFDRSELMIRLKKLLEIRKVLRKKFSNSEVEFLTPIQIREHDFLIKLRKILEENYEDENFDVTVFCEKISLSRVQVHRKLKALTGKSTSEFIRIFRLKKSKELLKNTDLNISQIAWKTGFSSPSVFNQNFRDAFNTTPGSFRRS